MIKNLKTTLRYVFLCIFFGLSFFAFSAHAEDSRDAELNDDRAIVDRPEYSEENPPHTRASSHSAFGLRVGIHGFPISSAIGDLYQLYGEWVLPFQKLGLFSVGANLGVFAMREQPTAFPYPNFLNTFSGGLFRYQLKVTSNQILVPTGAIELNYYRLMKPDRSYLGGTNIGASLGLFLNLGWIDTMTARDAYQSIKLSKAYLTMEVRSATFSNASFNLSGTFWLIGLRTEFE